MLTAFLALLWKWQDWDLKLHNDIIQIYESKTDSHANNVTYLGSHAYKLYMWTTSNEKKM